MVIRQVVAITRKKYHFNAKNPWIWRWNVVQYNGKGMVNSKIWESQSPTMKSNMLFKISCKKDYPVSGRSTNGRVNSPSRPTLAKKKMSRELICNTRLTMNGEIKIASGDFARFNWQAAYALWGMHRLRTCARWLDSYGQVHGEDREWLKENWHGGELDLIALNPYTGLGNTTGQYRTPPLSGVASVFNYDNNN